MLTDLLVPVLVIGGMLYILRLAMGGASRRSAAGRGYRIRLLPAYDREYYNAGALLAAIALWSLADAVPDLGTVFVLTLCLAFLYPARPELVGAAIGLIGSVSMMLSRLHDDSVAYSTSDRAAFWIGVGLTLVVLTVLRPLLVVAIRPMRLPVDIAAGFLRSWTSPGRSRPGASLLLATFGVLELLDLATQPGVLATTTGWGPATVPAAVLLVVCVAVLAVGMTLLPTFTISVLGLAVFAATLLLDVGLYGTVLLTHGPSAAGWPARILILVAFLAVAALGTRVVWSNKPLRAFW